MTVVLSSALTPLPLLAGDGIEIVEPDGLMVNVLPKYFRQGKLCSFIRQLNLYGFEKQKDKWEVNFRCARLLNIFSLVT